MSPSKQLNEVGEQVDVFVPTKGSSLEKTVLPGSGIVGSVSEDGIGVRVDYEGNKFNSPQLARFADKVAHAAGRHSGPDGVPVYVDRRHLDRVGYFDKESGEVVVEPTKKTVLGEWIGHTVEKGDLEAAGYRWEMDRLLKKRLEPEPPTPEVERQKQFVAPQTKRGTVR